MAKPELPESLAIERDAIIAEVYSAWRGVTREGGVSWSETFVLDDYGTMSERLAAREEDVEREWEYLVDNENWVVRGGFGGFSFLDAIGFRYYLAPELIRCVRTGWSEVLPFHLELRQGELHDFTLEKWSLLNDRQRRCVARALKYLAQYKASHDDRHAERRWWTAYNGHWKQFYIP